MSEYMPGEETENVAVSQKTEDETVGSVSAELDEAIELFFEEDVLHEYHASEEIRRETTSNELPAAFEKQEPAAPADYTPEAEAPDAERSQSDENGSEAETTAEPINTKTAAPLFPNEDPEFCEEITGTAIEISVEELLRKRAEKEVPSVTDMPEQDSIAEFDTVPSDSDETSPEERPESEEKSGETEPSRENDDREGNEEESLEASDEVTPQDIPDIKPEIKRRSHKGLWITLCIILVPVIVLAVLYWNVLPFFRAELGTGLPAASVFMRDGSEASYAESFAFSNTEENTYFVKITTVRGPRYVCLQVRDTLAPTAEDAAAVISMDARISPTEAVKNVYDASAWHARWKTEPMQGVPGIYSAEVELIDGCKNTSVIPVTVKILAVKEILEWELGDPLPTARDFLAASVDDAVLMTELAEMDLTHAGDHAVSVRADGAVYSSVLRIVDTVAPVFEARSVYALRGIVPEAESLVSSCFDLSEVTFSFSTPPEVSVPGTVPCMIRATDESGNYSEQHVTVTVCDGVFEEETVGYPLTAAQILKLAGLEPEDGTGSEELLPAGFAGTEALEIPSKEYRALIFYSASDTTPPEAAPVSISGYADYPHTPEEFVTGVSDASPVTLSFVDEPDWSEPCDRMVSVKVSDPYGNVTVVDAPLSLRADRTAPAVFGAADGVCYQFETPDCFADVFAQDDVDPAVVLKIDTDSVDVTECGEYTATIRCADRSGNETVVTVSVAVIERLVKENELESLYTKITEELFTAEMNEAERVKAVYDYLKTAIKRADVKKTSDWREAAYLALTDGKGDTFSVCSAARFLLRDLNCRMLTVYGTGEEPHDWLLVNLGLGWYHLDPCPVPDGEDGAFMLRSSELPLIEDMEDYWQFDAAAYPKTPDNAFVAAAG